MKTIQKALIYCRVSTLQQQQAISSQIKRCTDHANYKGYEVEKVFEDSYTGGGDFMNRPAMRQLLEYVDENLHTNYVVIFDDLKRYSRDTAFYLKLKAEFKYRNLIPECLNFNFEDTPEGEFIETIIVAHGQLERLQNKRQVIQKMKSRLDRGIYALGGSSPYGYKYISSKTHGGRVLEIVPEEAKVIKKAMEMFASEELYHMRDVQKYIRNNKISRGKVGCSLDTVKSMLTNVLYAGYVEYSKWGVKRNKGVHEGIITLDTFETIQDRIAGKALKRTRKDMRDDFPLRGLLLCSNCMKPFTGAWSTGRNNKYAFYRCIGKDCRYKNKSIAVKKVHENFENLLLKTSLNEDAQFLLTTIIKEQSIEKGKNLQGVLATLKEELNKVQASKSKFLNLIEESDDASLISIYSEKVKEFHLKEEKLSQKVATPINTHKDVLEPAMNIAFEVLKSPYNTWIISDLELKRKLIISLFGSVLNYDVFDGFGTAQKPYIIRFCDENKDEIDLVLQDVEMASNTWNNDTQIAYAKLREKLILHWEELTNSIYRLASLYKHRE